MHAFLFGWLLTVNVLMQDNWTLTPSSASLSDNSCLYCVYGQESLVVTDGHYTAFISLYKTHGLFASRMVVWLF